MLRFDSIRVSISLGICLAVFLITGFHVARFIGFDRFGSLQWLFRNGANDGVGLFFALSGLKLYLRHSKTSACRFYANRAFAILPAYYVSLSFWCLAVWLGDFGKPMDWWNVVSHVFLLHAVGNETYYGICGLFWYLGVLVWLYLAFPLLRRGVGFRQGLLLIAVSVLCLSCSPWVFKLTGSLFVRKMITCALPLFCFGLFLGKHVRALLDIGKRIPTCASAFLLLAIASLFLCFRCGSACNVLLSDARVVLVVVGLLSCQCLVERKMRCVQEQLNALAAASYSIYLYNYCFYFTKPVHRDWLTFFVLMVSVFGFGVVMHACVSGPLTRRLKWCLERSENSSERER